MRTGGFKARWSLLEPSKGLDQIDSIRSSLHLTDSNWLRLSVKLDCVARVYALKEKPLEPRHSFFLCYIITYYLYILKVGPARMSPVNRENLAQAYSTCCVTQPCARFLKMEGHEEHFKMDDR